MANPRPTPTGRAAEFSDNDLIVSKTDLRGIITYANDVFMRVSGYTEEELLGQPHNIVRHPEMPRCIFKYVWDTIKSGREFFGYVLNLAKNGDHYWVFAHATPNRNPRREIFGYHSNRRAAWPDALAAVAPLYASLLAIERRHSDPRAGMEASSNALREAYSAGGREYGDFVFGLSQFTRLEAAV